MAEEILEEEVLEETDDSPKGQFMTFQTGKEFYGINISYISEIVMMQSITPVPEVEDYIKGLINLRGKIIPVIDVRTRFKIPPMEYTDRTCIIIINVNSMVIGLIVEKIAEVVNITDDDIVPLPSLKRNEREQNKYVYGLARLDDTVKMLLDPVKLVKQEDLEKIEDNQAKEQE